MCVYFIYKIQKKPKMHKCCPSASNGSVKLQTFLLEFILDRLRHFYTCCLKSLTYFLQFGGKCPHVLFKAGWNFWTHRSENRWQPQDIPRTSPGARGKGAAGGFPVGLVFHWGSQPSLGMSAAPGLYLSLCLCSGNFCDLAEHVAAQTRYH